MIWKKKRSIADEHDAFFVQSVDLACPWKDKTRLEYFSDVCRGKSVLHVGFVGSDISSLNNNLHITLDAVAERLDGVDTNIAGFERLREHVHGGMYGDLKEVSSYQYDVVLVPEVLEHVDNVRDFLQAINEIEFSEIFVTVPDAAQCAKRGFFEYTSPERFTEVVHPDHNCWFSPYTLLNVIHKFTSWKVLELGLFNNISVLAHCAKQKPC